MTLTPATGQRALRAVSLGLAMVVGAGIHASAQERLATPPAERRVGVAFDAAAIVSRRDDIAFFNYTDYEHNALRVVRLRLMAEWRVAKALAVAGEARTEGGDTLEIPALYLRWRPWATRSVAIQAGRVPPLVGAFPRRAYSRENVVIGLPLAYQYLVSLRPDALPATVDDLLIMRGRGWQPSFPIGSQTLRPGLSLMNSARWDTGVQISARLRGLTLAGAVTEGPPAQPSVRDRTPGVGWSGRTSLTLPAGIVIGASGGIGGWINREVLDQVRVYGDAASQRVAGVEAEAGRGRWLVRTEWFHTTFALPMAAAPVRLGAQVGFVEGRYRFGARWQVGARAEWLRFARVQGSPARGLLSWDANVNRIETALSYRVTRSVDIKAGWQQNWRDGGRVRERGFPALQLHYWY